MNVYMYMICCSENPEPDIVLFQEKKDCLDFLNEEVDRMAETYGFERDDVDWGLNQWHFDTPQGYELTFIFREMEIK